jgi:hypothetical protein
MTDVTRYLDRLVDRDLSEAEDNLRRAERAFGGSNLHEEYGQSGRTKQEILNGYRDWVASATAAKNYLR